MRFQSYSVGLTSKSYYIIMYCESNIYGAARYNVASEGVYMYFTDQRAMPQGLYGQISTEINVLFCQIEINFNFSMIKVICLVKI